MAKYTYLQESSKKVCKENKYKVQKSSNRASKENGSKDAAKTIKQASSKKDIAASVDFKRSTSRVFDGYTIPKKSKTANDVGSREKVGSKRPGENM